MKPISSFVAQTVMLISCIAFVFSVFGMIWGLFNDNILMNNFVAIFLVSSIGVLTAYGNIHDN